MDKTMRQGRGQLTERIKARSKELLGYEITVRQLRLMPYLASLLQNKRFIDNRGGER